MDYTNSKIKGIHISRYLASYMNVCRDKGIPFDYWDFCEWLAILKVDGERLTSDELDHILQYCESGKFELQCSAKEFLNAPVVVVPKTHRG